MALSKKKTAKAVAPAPVKETPKPKAPAVSTPFKNRVQEYLNNFATQDELFAVSLKKENKNIDECCAYIMNEVKKLGVQGIASEEVFAMAVHYYDEDNIKDVSAPPNCKVVIDKHVELTEEEKAAAKQKAIDDLVSSEKARMLAKKTVKKPEASKAAASTEKTNDNNELTLF